MSEAEPHELDPSDMVRYTSGIRANLLLCDAAQVVGGKLYILGGGWSYLFLSQPTAAFAVAIDLVVPWDMANRQLKMAVRIATPDFEDYIPEGIEEPVRAEGDLVVGRPPNARAGADLHVPIVIPFAPVPLVPGGYVCEVSIDGEPITNTTFQVAHLPGNQHPGGPPA